MPRPQLFRIGLLAVVGLPHALGNFHVGEDRRERRLFRRAGVDAEGNLVTGRIHVADAQGRAKDFSKVCLSIN